MLVAFQVVSPKSKSPSVEGAPSAHLSEDRDVEL
jgi:hypothetical protein